MSLFRFKRIAILAAGGLLVTLVGVQLVAAARRATARGSDDGTPVAQQLPDAVQGWQCRDLPLGATEALAKESERILQLDDFVHRDYHAGTVTLNLYIAYWRPGSASFRNVAPHRPDVCWVQNGWSIIDRESAVTLSRYDANGGPGDLQPAEWRCFRPPGALETRSYVLYWNLVDRQITDHYRSRKTSIGEAWRWWWREAVQIVHGRPEQYFIRLSSNVPFAEIWDDPGVQQIIASLAEIGLVGEKANREG